MPIAESPLSSTAQRNAGGQGGTALQPESNKLWIIAGVAILTVIAIVVIQARSSSTNEGLSSSKTQVETEVETDVDENAPIAITPTEQTPIGIELEQEDTEKIEIQRQAISELTETLKRARLWTTISISTASDSVLSIVSGACEDEAMKPNIQKVAATLKTAEFTTVRCVAKHGALLFELSL